MKNSLRVRPAGSGISGEEELTLSVEVSFGAARAVFEAGRATVEAVVRAAFVIVGRAVFEHAEGSESARLAAILDTDSGPMSEDIVAAGVGTDAIVCNMSGTDVAVTEEPSRVAIALVEVESVVIKLDDEGTTEPRSVLVIFEKGDSVEDA